MIYYKRISSGKPPVRWTIVDEDGNIVNKNPNKNELKNLDKFLEKRGNTKREKYNDTNTCNRCRINFDDVLGHPLREYDKDGNETGKWICNKCYQRDDRIERYKIGHRRTGNLNPSSTQILGDNSLELACVLYGWEDLNKKHDNYSKGTPIDCYDPKTGLYHQVQGRHYNSKRRNWPFASFKREWGKNYETMICFCISEDGKIVERIYIFPLECIVENEIKSVTITKNPTRGRYNTPFTPWYEDFREISEDELSRANNIWKGIIKKK